MVVERDHQGPAAFYQAALDRRELFIQYCKACNSHVHYPRFACPHCGVRGLQWHQASGRGSIYAFTLLPQTDGSFCNTALVDLEEGVRLVSTIRTLNPEGLSIGQAVLAAFDTGATSSILVFDAVDA